MVAAAAASLEVQVCSAYERAATILVGGHWYFVQKKEEKFNLPLEASQWKRSLCSSSSLAEMSLERMVLAAGDVAE